MITMRNSQHHYISSSSNRRSTTRLFQRWSLCIALTAVIFEAACTTTCTADGGRGSSGSSSRERHDDDDDDGDTATITTDTPLAYSTKHQCGDSTTFCASTSNCCTAQYSPTGFGCSSSSSSAVRVQNTDTGTSENNDPSSQSYCCTPGPELEPLSSTSSSSSLSSDSSDNKKNCLVIGDSVSIGYTGIVAELLEDECLVQHAPFDVSNGGAGNTTYGKACLDNWLVTQRQTLVHWDVIVFNFGLHNLVNTQPATTRYRNELTNITHRLLNNEKSRTEWQERRQMRRRGGGGGGDKKNNNSSSTSLPTTTTKTKTKLIYATTTPFMPARTHNDMIVEDLNKIARQVMKNATTERYRGDDDNESQQNTITIVDLYKVITDHCGGDVYDTCDWCQTSPCTYHYNSNGSTALARHVADAIRSVLNLRRHPTTSSSSSSSFI